MSIIQLTDCDMESWEGLQYFSEEEAKDKILRCKLNAIARKDEKPTWAKEWRQTWTLIKK